MNMGLMKKNKDHEHYEYEDYGYDKELADYFRTLDADR